VKEPLGFQIRALSGRGHYFFFFAGAFLAAFLTAFLVAFFIEVILRVSKLCDLKNRSVIHI
jgi:hypothetical protein